MKKVNNVLVYVFSLISICIGVFYFNKSDIPKALASVLIIIVFLLPYVIDKLFKLKLSEEFKFVFNIFIILAEFFGCAINLYNTVWWYDLFAHFLSGVLVSVLSILILFWFKAYKESNVKFNAFFMLCFNVFVAGIWEFIEFLINLAFHNDVQHSLTTGVNDTMEDMLIAFLGGLIVFVIYIVSIKKKNNFFSKLTKK